MFCRKLPLRKVLGKEERKDERIKRQCYFCCYLLVCPTIFLSMPFNTCVGCILQLTNGETYLSSKVSYGGRGEMTSSYD